MDRKQQDRLVNKYCMNCEVGLYNCKIHLLDCTKVQEGEKKNGTDVNGRMSIAPRLA